MHINVQRLISVKSKVKEIINKNNISTVPEIIAVCKKFSLNEINPLLEFGHIHFGENKIQEAESKWNSMKLSNNKIQLHMVGKLQSNKAKKALMLFDYIHSLDSKKLADKLSYFEKLSKKKIKYFIQINIGEEEQKSGIFLKDLKNFYDYCSKTLLLNIVGFMCLPPNDSDPDKFFEILKKLSAEYKLSDISMGMSGDYEKAVVKGSTFLRLGTSIFGERSS
ncbi:YggS family pyridoxal phosphate-dependent enzyme [Pelagibacteraceae bacterium]|nr:YggS family pyridoxal phosphate-dependent enzyme [Pelagibacteraceae bacterium]